MTAPEIVRTGRGIPTSWVAVGKTNGMPKLAALRRMDVPGVVGDIAAWPKEAKVTGVLLWIGVSEFNRSMTCCVSAATWAVGARVGRLGMACVDGMATWVPLSGDMAKKVAPVVVRLVGDGATTTPGAMRTGTGTAPSPFDCKLSGMPKLTAFRRITPPGDIDA